MQERIKVAIQTLHTDMQNLAHAWQVTLCPKCSSCYTAVATLSAYQRLCCLASMPGLLCLFDTAPDVASCMIVKLCPTCLMQGSVEEACTDLSPTQSLATIEAACCLMPAVCMQATQNPRRCATQVAQVAKMDVWLAKALSKLHACQLLPEPPSLVVQDAVSSYA